VGIEEERGADARLLVPQNGVSIGGLEDDFCGAVHPHVPGATAERVHHPDQCGKGVERIHLEPRVPKGNCAIDVFSHQFEPARDLVGARRGVSA
jgi:hypothetical protein